jgi:hypothetical protein
VLLSGPHPASLAGEAAAVQTTTDVDGVRYELTAYRSLIGASLYFDGTDATRTR